MYWAELSGAPLRVTSKLGWADYAMGKEPAMQMLGPEFESPALIKSQVCLSYWVLAG